jgi:enoyl-CoA hydratase/carnithine racemase
MQYHAISLEIRERVAFLRLDRPSSRSEMNDEMASEFQEKVRRMPGEPGRGEDPD